MNEILRSKYSLKEFSDEEIKKLLILFEPQIIVCSKDTVLIETNTKADFIGIVLRGEVAAQRRTVSGSVYIERTYSKGELFGDEAVFSSPGIWPTSIVVTVSSTVLILNMRKLIEKYTVIPEVWIFYSTLVRHMDEINRAMFQRIVRSVPDVRGRILAYLDLMNDKFQGRPFKFRMKREELAEYLNVSRSSLFRELKNLREEKIIEIDKNNMVTFRSELIPKYDF